MELPKESCKPIQTSQTLRKERCNCTDSPGTLTFRAITLLESKIPKSCQEGIPAACNLVKKTPGKKNIVSFEVVQTQKSVMNIVHKQPTSPKSYDHRSRKQDENIHCHAPLLPTGTLQI